MTGRTRRGLLTLGKGLLTALLVLFLLSRISVTEAASLLGAASWPYLFAALLVFTLSMMAGAWQWGRFLAALGIDLSPPKLLELYWVGLFFNNFMPGNVGGDVVKVLDLRRGQRDPVASATATLADRLTGLSALAMLAFLAGWRLSGDAGLRPLARPVLWGSAIFLLLGIFFLLDPVARTLRRLASRFKLLPEEGFRARVLEQLRQLRRHRVLLLRLFVFSLLVQSLRVAVHFLVGRALLGEACPLLFDFFLVIPPLAFALTLPITIGGLGLREGLALPLFAPTGVSGEATVAIELLAYLCMLLVSLQGGFLFFLRRGERDAEEGRPA